MRNGNKVLACVDKSRFADHVADYAAWAAARMDAPLELLHVIGREAAAAPAGDRSGAIGIDAQEHLLAQLSSEDEARAKAAREAGRVLLKRLRERATAAGATAVDVRQRLGELAETVAEQEAGVRLIVLGRRGEAAELSQRDLGRNVERIVRALHKPILTVTEGYREPRRAMFAFDGGGVTRRGVDMVAASPLLRGLPIHLLMSGKERADASRQLEWARSTLEAAGFAATAAWIPGDAETVIARTASAEAIDLLIMGGYSHAPLRTMLMGSTTTDLLRSASIPTLLLR